MIFIALTNFPLADCWLRCVGCVFGLNCRLHQPAIAVIFLGLFPSPMRQKLELNGQRFGRLLVESFDRVHGGHSRWNCLCSCGVRAAILSNHLRTGRTRSCGCLQQESRRASNITHGMSKTRPYSIWHQMVKRASDLNNPSYGGRGVTVCPRWVASFESFWEDMHEGYSDKLTIGRKDNDLGYCKANCRWETWQEQFQNRRTTVWVQTPSGRMSLSSASRAAGLSVSMVAQRRRAGWPEERWLEPRRR